MHIDQEPPLLLPELTDFSELFDTEFTDKLLYNDRHIRMEDGGFGEELHGINRATYRRNAPLFTVGSYIHARAGHGMKDFPYFSISCRPTDKLIQLIRENFIFVEWDTTDTEIIVFRAGRRRYVGRLIVNYGQIIGSRRITDSLDISTVPGLMDHLKKK